MGNQLSASKQDLEVMTMPTAMLMETEIMISNLGNADQPALLLHGNAQETIRVAVMAMGAPMAGLLHHGLLLVVGQTAMDMDHPLVGMVVLLPAHPAVLLRGISKLRLLHQADSRVMVLMEAIREEVIPLILPSQLWVLLPVSEVALAV